MKKTRKRKCNALAGMLSDLLPTVLNFQVDIETFRQGERKERKDKRELVVDNLS